MKSSEQFEIGEIVCSKCKNTLLEYHKDGDSPEIELTFNFKNAIIEKFKITHDCCCEASNQILQLKCNTCHTISSVYTYEGGQSIDIDIEVYDENNNELNDVIKKI